MAVSPAAPVTVTGRVVSSNPKGLKLDGDDHWLNFSKFAQDIVPPERGQSITVTLDRAGFVRAIEPAEGGPGATPVNRTAHGVTSGARDRTITRLAVLKAAAEFGAARPDLKSGEVLLIAESWERWVLRDEEEDAEHGA